MLLIALTFSVLSCTHQKPNDNVKSLIDKAAKESNADKADEITRQIASMGKSSYPILVEGLDDPSENVRMVCALALIQQKEFVDTFDIVAFFRSHDASHDRIYRVVLMRRGIEERSDRSRSLILLLLNKHEGDSLIIDYICMGWPQELIRLHAKKQMSKANVLAVKRFLSKNPSTLLSDAFANAK